MNVTTIAAAMAAAETRNASPTRCIRDCRLSRTVAAFSLTWNWRRPSINPLKVPMMPMPVNRPGRCLKNSVRSRLSTTNWLLKYNSAGAVARIATTASWPSRSSR